MNSPDWKEATVYSPAHANRFTHYHAPHMAFVNTAAPGFAVDDKIPLDWQEILAANAKLREQMTLDDEPDDFTPRMSKRETEHAANIHFNQPH